MDRLERLSRLVSGILRHFPDKVGLKLDGEGWVDIGELVRAIRERWRNREAYRWLREEHIYIIAERDPKGRFEVRGGRIRARYGHSVPVNIRYPRDDEVKVLYHGTSPSRLPSILREGIKPMRRIWVHLSPTVEDAERVAMRRTGSPVVIEIDADRLRRYTPIYRASPHVYLAKMVPPSCIRAVHRRGSTNRV